MKKGVLAAKGWSSLVLMISVLVLSGCGGGGGSSSTTTTTTGGGTPAAAASTTISGKVALSSAVLGKPALNKAMLNAPKGKPGSKIYSAAKSSSSSPLHAAVLGSGLHAVQMTSGNVYLYNSDHPEWLSPVASSATDSAGAYTLSVLENAAANGNAYKDGDPIPSGNYTLLAYKPGGFDPVLGVTTKAMVAVQTVVNKFEGTVSLADMVAQESTVSPTVVSMMGVKKNTDGTETWGGASTKLPANAAIQVTFSAAMSRGNLNSAITISPAVSGKWTLSADWTVATFYPDAGATLADGTVYTVTVNGANGSGGANGAVKNVYGNALAKTATGSFTATPVDSVAPTASWVSPTTLEMGSPVDLSKPIRIGSNKQLDVNSLLLEGKVAGVSSLGAKPGVVYVGYDATNGYVYEFVLGAPLKLGTTYDLTVSGGKGVNGLSMNALSGSLQTQAAGNTAGVDSTATAATQDAQAAVRGVLGKWIRSFSDRNITQLQSMMAGDFYFEDKNNSAKDDVNKDGRLSLEEFSSMMVNRAFPNWEYCNATITGDVVGTINVVGDVADFEFKMTASTSNTSQMCLDTLPVDPFYATVKNVNGAWTIARASVGVDTRAKTLNHPNLIDNLVLTQGGTTISDGGTAQSFVWDATGSMTNPLTFQWDATTGVSSYVLLRIDGRNPEVVRACALNSGTTKFTIGVGACTSVDAKFGNNNNAMMPSDINADGAQVYWEVIGLGATRVADISKKTTKELLQDIVAISVMPSYNVAGVYKEIKASVFAGATASGTSLSYSMNVDGYDAGSASQATFVVTTGNTAATLGYLGLSGNFTTSYPLNFVNGQATVTVDLSKGMNWISVDDGMGLWDSFNISTTGGIPPVVDITSVKDQVGNSIIGDVWNYYNAPGATTITVSGTTSNPAITTLDLNVWNSALGANSYTQVPVTNGAFSATVEVYKGDNWINVGAGFNDPVTNIWNWYGDYAGVYTDTGTVWVPNVGNVAVSVATLSNDYGNSQDWDASTDPDNKVTVSGKFKTPLNGTYNINSDGGWSTGTLIALADGSFSLDVDLFNGWNYVYINDANYNWYGINIYTSAGKTVVKPTITAVNGVAPVTTVAGGAKVSVADCVATVTGTAKAGNLSVYWSGSDGINSYWEYQTLLLTGTDPVAFSFTVPLVGGTGSFNSIDLNDASGVWAGVQVTTTGACTYTAPAMTLATVLDSAGTATVLDAFGYYQGGTSTTVTLQGTSTRPGRAISADLWACSNEHYTTVASTTPNVSGTYDWAISGVKVYDQYNYVNVSDGSNWSSANIFTTNGVLAAAPLQAAVTAADAGGAAITPTLTYTGTCGYKNWDVGAATAITISGTTTAPDGNGTYTDASGATHTFAIAGGSFSITGIALYDGGNTISINDTAWNYQSLYVSTLNGVMKPQFVSITAPVAFANTAAGVTSGVQTVTGTIVDANASGYKPDTVHAMFGRYDATTFMWTYVNYSSSATDQAYGDSPITYDAATGAYSFSADFGLGDYSYINVYAYDMVNYANHGAMQYYNDSYSNYSSYYKPGAVSQITPRQRAISAKVMQQKAEQMSRRR